MASAKVSISPFSIDVDDAVLEDLRDRVARTRWPDPAAGAAWDSGTDDAYLKDLLRTWGTDFDWRARETDLNRLAHFRADVDGTVVHFVHERGRGPSPLPLILTHGWPSTFAEYLELIPLLTDPEAHGGDRADAFDVVVPSLPGFGFSPLPSRPGPIGDEVAGLWRRLMADGLGYTRFGAQGTDIGAGVTARLGLRHPGSVAGIHLSATGLLPPPQPWSPAEQEYLAGRDRWIAEEGAYAHQHATKPQTLGFGLTDSPAGLAGWIVEKLRSWSDCGGDVESRFSRDWILSTLTIYWATSTIASSMRHYQANQRRGVPLTVDDPVRVPAGYASFANEHNWFGAPPREMFERYFANLTRWTDMPSGGHFPAMEEPEALAVQLREFFRPLR